MFRYLALISNSSCATENAHLNALARKILVRGDGDFRCVFDSVGLKVFCADLDASACRAIVMPDRSGVIVGTLFRRLDTGSQDCSPQITQLTADCTRQIARTNGGHLFSSYWGRYVAFLVNQHFTTRYVLKDPTGRLPCLLTRTNDVTVVFSCVADCVELGLLRFEVDWQYVCSRVSRCVGEWGQTGLSGVKDIIGGTRLTLSGDKTEEAMLWRPHEIASSAPLNEVAPAADALRATVDSCVGSWVSTHSNVVCRTSGGLDSTIVLSSLSRARTNPKVTCVTYFGRVGSDETRWAGIAANHLGYTLNAQECDVEVPMGALQAMQPLAIAPPDYSWALLGEWERDLGKRNGATAVVTGDGGDSVFGGSCAEFACRDFRIRRGLQMRAILALAIDVALVTNRSIWSVLTETFGSQPETVARRDAERLRLGRLLVSEEVFRQSNAEHAPHPWFRSQGRSALSDILNMVVQSDLYYNPARSPADFDLEPVYPLCSQPLVELCLRIPSYIHFTDGRSRGLARRAFAGHLPVQIAERQWKDASADLDYILIRRYGPAIREFLVHGELVRTGVLDRNHLEQSLAGAPGKRTAGIHEITDHLIVEAWLQSWRKVAQERAAD
jgi:asparagine synthase (glutamine-hydrolysing)